MSSVLHLHQATLGLHSPTAAGWRYLGIGNPWAADWNLWNLLFSITVFHLPGNFVVTELIFLRVVMAAPSTRDGFTLMTVMLCLLLLIPRRVNAAAAGVDIINNLTSAINVHCQSPDSDLGPTQVDPTGQYEFNFRPSPYGLTAYNCVFTYQNRTQEFNVWEGFSYPDRLLCSEERYCMWRVDDSGFSWTSKSDPLNWTLYKPWQFVSGPSGNPCEWVWNDFGRSCWNQCSLIHSYFFWLAPRYLDSSYSVDQLWSRIEILGIISQYP